MAHDDRSVTCGAAAPPLHGRTLHARALIALAEAAQRDGDAEAAIILISRAYLAYDGEPDLTVN